MYLQRSLRFVLQPSITRRAENIVKDLVAQFDNNLSLLVVCCQHRKDGEENPGVLVGSFALDRRPEVIVRSR